MENPRIWLPTASYFSSVGFIICPFTISVPEGTRLILCQAGVPWFYGIKFRTDVGLLHNFADSGHLELQDLEGMRIPKKNKILSIVTSLKSITHGHRWRLQLTEALIKYFGSNIDAYGFGWNPLSDKSDALDGYYYTIAIENEKSDHYFTEKLSDPILSYTAPIYSGANKVNEYFPYKIETIDYGCDIIHAVDKIKEIINTAPSIDGLSQNRHSLLYEHNIFHLLINVINSLG